MQTIVFKLFGHLGYHKQRNRERLGVCSDKCAQSYYDPGDSRPQCTHLSRIMCTLNEFPQSDRSTDCPSVRSYHASVPCLPRNGRSRSRHRRWRSNALISRATNSRQKRLILHPKQSRVWKARERQAAWAHEEPEIIELLGVKGAIRSMHFPQQTIPTDQISSNRTTIFGNHVWEGKV
jgi:hypothetical protein